MTIVDLIRKGCSIYPEQAFRTGIDDEKNAACVRGALHAAYAHRTGKNLTFDDKGRCMDVYKSNPLNAALSGVSIEEEDIPEEALKKITTPPPHSLKRVITTLNDERKWSRKDIARWIEQNGHDTTVQEATHS